MSFDSWMIEIADGGDTLHGSHNASKSGASISRAMRMPSYKDVSR